MANPRISVIIIFHNMCREAKRTLATLSNTYQLGIETDQYEVIAIDNGSTVPLDSDFVRSIGPQFCYHFLKTRSVSPVRAVNAGAQMAAGEYLAVIVDGARMLSPGLVGLSLKATKMDPNPYICALSWHLGPDVQNNLILQGYDQIEEDRLLDQVDWLQNGYELFNISTLTQSSTAGFLGGIPPECSWFVMRRDTFLSLGGFNQRFQAPGGGLANHDFRNRALQVPGMTPYLLLGEGVFHQFHGGVATNVKPKDHPMPKFQREYHAIHGHYYEPLPTPEPVLVGRLSEKTLPFLAP